MIADLIARVEAATGPDREIDAMVARVVCDWDVFSVPDLIGGTVRLARDGARTFEVPRWSASIDAVVELIRREMPGAEWSISATGLAEIAAAYVPGCRCGWTAPTPALALLLAFLRAMQARQENDHG